ncbi:MAG: hypothetical protein N2167_10850 [Flavobacteriales bacterium]|nr:hypothetical protein [Flavobacteriales bacterium]
MKMILTLNLALSLHIFGFSQIVKNAGTGQSNTSNTGSHIGVRTTQSYTGSNKPQVTKPQNNESIFKPSGGASYSNNYSNTTNTNTQNNNTRPQFTDNTTNNNYYYGVGAGSTYNPNNFSYSNNVGYNFYGSPNYIYQSNTNTYQQEQAIENFEDLSFGSSVYMIDAEGSRVLLESSANPDAVANAQKIRDRIKNNTVHFTGLVMSDNYWESHTSKAFMDDKYSEFLTPGKYERIGDYLPNSVKYTFDGIAVPTGTRLIIYSGTNFTGNVLVDITGPAIINNVKWKNDPRYMNANTKTYVPELQGEFPPTVRQWSVSNMHEWQNGSIEIQKLN